MKFQLLLCLTIFCCDFAFAQDSDSVSLQQAIDAIQSPTQSFYQSSDHDPRELSRKNGYAAEPVEVKKFDQQKWKEIIGDEDYSEESRQRKQKGGQQFDNSSDSEAGGQRYLEEDEDSSDSENSGKPINSLLLNIIFYGITFGIVGYILFLIVKNTSLKSRTKIKKDDLSDASAQVTDIKELEVDRLLREAMASANYRLAIRIYFLGLLKKLDEDGLITWKKDKTNRDYLSELFSKEYYFEEVKDVTLAYEQVWYGDHTFSTQAYEKIISSFQAINQKIIETKAP